MKKVQLPVVGGVRKVVRVPDPAATRGTAIAGYEAQTLTLAQLKALLGTVPVTGGGTTIATAPSATLALGQGLSGGGPLVGIVPVGFTAPIPALIFEEGGGGDGDPGPPGQRGQDGIIGHDGAPGASVYMVADDPEEPLMAVPGPKGADGAPGAAGAAGPPGPAILFIGDEAVDGDPGPPGPPGAAGGSGLAPVFGTFTAPPQTGWTWQAQGSDSYSADAYGSMLIAAPANGNTNRTSIIRTFAGGNYDVQMACSVSAVYGNYLTLGIQIQDSSTSNAVVFALALDASPNYNIMTLTGGTTFNASVTGSVGINAPFQYSPVLWLRVKRTGTSDAFYISIDGTNWVLMYTYTGNFAATPDRVGIHFYNYLRSGTTLDAVFKVLSLSY
jgi:hypothetical protein